MATTTIRKPPKETESRKMGKEPRSALLLTLTLSGFLAFALVHDRSEIGRAITAHPFALGFWIVLILLVDLWPVPAAGLRLMLDMPLLLAVGFLYPPVVAAGVAVVAVFDRREIERGITISHAIFNRVQIALSVYVASIAFHSLALKPTDWPGALYGTVLAVLIESAINLLLVLSRVGLTGFPRLRPADWKLNRLGQHQAIDLGYGLLALIVARLFQAVGAWSVVTIMLPILAARQMLVRGDRLRALAARLREREKLLQRALNRMVEERKDERVRIAGELHDEVLQSLIFVWQTGLYVERRLVKAGPSQELHELVDATEATMQSLRTVISDLRQSPLGRGGLVPTLRSLVRDLSSAWNVPIRLHCPDSGDASAGLQVTIYQVAREALMNALKHSGTETVDVFLAWNGDSVDLSVVDKGEGFDVDMEAMEDHFGLRLMAERVRNAGGTLKVESQTGLGTRVEARFRALLNPGPSQPTGLG